MRRLLGRANSSNVMKVIWLLEELGLPYERQDVGGRFGGNDTAEYRALNPNGVVPTLVEDGFVLWESNVILRYLAAANPGGERFWPADPRARAHVDRWMDWQQTALGPPMAIVFWGLVRPTPENSQPETIAKGKARLGQLYGLLDATLARTPFVTGDQLSVADMAIGVHLHRWMSFDFERPHQPHVDAYYRRLLDRPAYRTHVAQPMT